MKAKITTIADPGHISKERVVIKVSGDLDIGSFAIMEAGVRGGEITTGIVDVYWFPDKEVAAGDIVVLYTKNGTPNEKALKSGGRAHFFYWGAVDVSKWQGKDVAPVLVEIAEWQAFVRKR
jgi:hypothetical protein